MSPPIKLFLLTATVAAISIFAYTYHFQQKNKRSLSKKSNRALLEHKEESGDSKLQEVGDRMQQEFEKIRNPTTLTIPEGALLKAKNTTEKLLQSAGSRSNVFWTLAISLWSLVAVCKGLGGSNYFYYSRCF